MVVRTIFLCAAVYLLVLSGINSYVLLSGDDGRKVSDMENAVQLLGEVDSKCCAEKLPLPCSLLRLRASSGGDFR
jgi:hypothetical protein